MQAQTEPKLHPETANMEFDQVITKRSSTLKGDLKVKLEPRWFLRRSHWKFHVSDFRATLLFTSHCAHGIMLWTWVEHGGAIAIPVKHGTQQIVENQLKVFYVSGSWMADDSGNWMALLELLAEH